jgi:hypothetical protein
MGATLSLCTYFPLDYSLSHGPLSACRMPEGMQNSCIRTDCSLNLLVAIAYSTRRPQTSDYRSSHIGEKHDRGYQFIFGYLVGTQLKLPDHDPVRHPNKQVLHTVQPSAHAKENRQGNR